MRILEVRDGFIKFESEKRLTLASFLQIRGEKKSYIAQVIKTNSSGVGYITYAKMLFLYDGSLYNYDKTLPELTSTIEEFPYEIIKNAIVANSPIVVGKTLESEEFIIIDKHCFDKKLLISIDNSENKRTILSNFQKQFSKTLIIDMLGTVDSPQYIAGSDFRLPLNTESLNFMFEDCLSDVTSDSKELIKEIFRDLSEYSKSVNFLPITILKSIIDEMVDKAHIFKLLVLKNKLAKFVKYGYFATTASESESLLKILSKDNTVIDLSKLDPIFQNRYLSVIYSELEKLDSKPQVFIEASNAINKKSLKNVLTSETIPAVFMTHSRFKYLNEIKSFFENCIIEPSHNNSEMFKAYSVFLKSMPKDTFIITGNGTGFIPLVSTVSNLDLDSVCVSGEPEQEKNDTEDKYIELEEALEASSPCETENELPNYDNSESDEAIVAIDKKAENLIEQVSEEVGRVELASDTDIFGEVSENENENEEEEFSAEKNLELENVAISVDTQEESLVTEENISEVELNIVADVNLELEQPDLLKEDVVEELSEADIEAVDSEPLQTIDSEESDITVSFPVEEFHTEIDEIQTIEIPEDISILAEEAEMEANSTEPVTAEEDSLMSEETDLVEAEGFSETNIEPIQLEDDFDQDEPSNTIEEISIKAIDNDIADDDFGEIIELDGEEIPEDVILVDFEDDVEEMSQEDSESLDREIVQDVDKVFTTIKEESISDSDLDFIDELNNEVNTSDSDDVDDSESGEAFSSDFEELPELQELEDSGEEFLEPVEELVDLQENDNNEVLETRNSSTPIVPVYGAEIPQEDIVVSDSIEQGDFVTHAKYGNGVVEKMIKYGTKTLFSINFDNVGRRLLDPTLTEIKKA